MQSLEKMYQIFQPFMGAVETGPVMEILEKIIASWPELAIAHNDLAVCYYNEKEKEKALHHYREAARLQPDNTTFLKNLADFYYVESKMVEEALQLYVRVIEINPEDIETLLVIGHTCVSLGKFDDARHFYKRVEEIEPWNSDVKEYLDKIENAGAAKTGAGSAEEMYQAVQSMINMHQPLEAIQSLNKLLAEWPDFAIAHNDLGVLYYNEGEKEKALAHYQEAARLQPDNITFLKNLADFYYVESGQVEEALQLYVKVLKINPEDIETLLAAGHICMSLNNPEDAKVFYQRILEIEPWNREARERLEEI